MASFNGEEPVEFRLCFLGFAEKSLSEDDQAEEGSHGTGVVLTKLQNATADVIPRKG